MRTGPKGPSAGQLGESAPAPTGSSGKSHPSRASSLHDPHLYLAGRRHHLRPSMAVDGNNVQEHPHHRNHTCWQSRTFYLRHRASRRQRYVRHVTRGPARRQEMTSRERRGEAGYTLVAPFGCIEKWMGGAPPYCYLGAGTEGSGLRIGTGASGERGLGRLVQAKGSTQLKIIFQRAWEPSF